MHIVLIETTSVRGFDIVEEMAGAGIEVSFVAQDLRRHLALHDPAKLAQAARLIEVPALGTGCDLAALLAGRTGPNRIDGVICRDEVYAPDVARLTLALGLRGESEETARLLGDKSAVRERLTEAGIGTLRWRKVGDAKDLLEAAAFVGYPLVVKPVSGGYSLGVTVVADEAGLVAALEAAGRGSAAAADARAVALLEEFAPGRLVSAELLVQDGEPVLLGFAERDACPPDVTAEIGGHFPARFDGVDAARAFALDVVRALGVRDSAVHMEMMITPRGPELIEVNGRVAGHVVIQQMSRALGRSIVTDLVDVAVGRPLAPLGEPVGTVALRQLWSDVAGTVRAVRVPQDLGRDVVLHGVQVRPGQRVAALTSNRDRFGFVLAEGIDPQQATENAAAAAARLLRCIDIEADGQAPAVAAREGAAAPAPTAGRQHVLLIDRLGATGWTRQDGAPLFPPDRYRVSVITSADAAAATPCAPTDALIRMDVFDHDGVARRADALNRETPLDRIATLSERLLLPAAQLRRRHALDGDTPVRVNRFIDKAVMKTIARKSGIRCADGGVLHRPHDLRGLQGRHGAVVVKPRASSGSQGVAILRSAAQVEEWLARDYAPHAFLGEQYVAGDMCHIDALVFRGEILWDASRYLRDTLAYYSGAPLSSQTLPEGPLRDAAHRLLRQVVDGWEIDAAVLHLEAFAAPDGMTFCEVAARPGGAGIVEAFEATRGVNLDHAKLLLDCGDDPYRLYVEPVAEHAGWTMHYATGSGVLAHYDDSAVAAHAHHRKYAARRGQAIGQSKFSGSALSTHTFARRTPDEVLDLLRLTERAVTFEVTQEPVPA